MQKDRREIIAIGELALFVAAWMFGIVAVVADYRGRTHLDGGNEYAATSHLRDVLE